MKSTTKEKILLILLLLFTFVLRTYKIESVPPSLYYDEIDAGFQAKSLIETGKDYRGGYSPFFVQSFLDPRPPIPIYFTALTTLIFSTPELQIRMPSAILGTLVVWLIFLIIKQWTNNKLLSLLTAFTFATNPWMIQFSRYSHETSSTLFLFLSSIYLFFKFLKTKKYNLLIFSSILLSLTMYTYRTMSFFVPVTFIILFVLYFKSLTSLGFKKLFIVALISGFITLPFLYSTTISTKNGPRINQISIFSEQSVPVWVQRNRELDSGDLGDDAIGKSAAKSSFIFHSKYISYLDAFFNNYFQDFSTEYLFISGDTNLRHSVGKMGELFFIDILPLIFGFYFLTKNFKYKYMQLLLVLLLVSPIAASLTSDGAKHNPRLSVFSFPLLTILGFGWWQLLTSIQKIRFSKILFAAILFIWVGLFTFYLHRYYVHFPVESARNFGFGFKQLVLKIDPLKKDYKTIAIVPTNDPPNLYYIFWSKTNPKLIQKYGADFSDKQSKDSPLYNLRTLEWPNGIGLGKKLFEYLRADTLYSVTRRELEVDLRNNQPAPKGVKVLDVITYPDNEVAFYLITKDTTVDIKDIEVQ